MSTSQHKAVIVVPTCRPEAIYDFLDAWKAEFGHHKVIVTEDSDQRKIDFGRYPNVEAYSAAEWKQHWGERVWIFPRGNAGHRAFGYWRAWQHSLRGECDMIVTLDDDCFPDQPDFLEKHYRVLSQKRILEWTTSIPGDWPFLPRGFPYNIREGRPAMVNHGLWSNIPDLDAPTQLLHPDARLGVYETESKLIPWGTYFPFCGMNVAWKPEATPLLYFLLMGKGWPYDRFDDIWAGVFMKKICDHLRWCVFSGAPSVRHSRMSNVFNNLRKEANGIGTNEGLWEHVHGLKLQGEDPSHLYLQLAAHVRKYSQEEYFRKLAEAMELWIGKFEEDRKARA